MKVTRTTMNNWLLQLEETIEAKEEALGNAEDAESPNEERVEKLEEELSLLEEIQGAIQAYVDM